MPSMTETSPLIRVSSLAGWTDCPRRSAARTFRDRLEADGYVLRDRANIVSASVGTGLHAGVAHALREKIEERVAKLARMVEISIETYRADTAEGVDYDSTTDSANTAERQLGAMNQSYYADVLPVVEPVTVETRMEARTAAGFTVSGQPDMLDAAAAVHDLKSGKAGDTYQAQLGGYLLLAKANGQPAPVDAVIDWVPRSRLSKPQPVAVSYRYPAAMCEAEAKAVLNQITHQWTDYKAKQDPAAFPCNPMSMLCGPKYCAAYGSEWCVVSKTFTD